MALPDQIQSMVLENEVNQILSQFTGKVPSSDNKAIQMIIDNPGLILGGAGSVAKQIPKLLTPAILSLLGAGVMNTVQTPTDTIQAPTQGAQQLGATQLPFQSPQGFAGTVLQPGSLLEAFRQTQLPREQVQPLTTQLPQRQVQQDPVVRSGEAESFQKLKDKVDVANNMDELIDARNKALEFISNIKSKVERNKLQKIIDRAEQQTLGDLGLK